MNKSNNYIKSPLNYTGGKYQLLEQIMPLFPKDIDCFIDLFCGGCNVGVNINANKIICNDNSKELIELMNYFKENNLDLLLKDIDEMIDKYELSKTSLYGYENYNTIANKGLATYNKENFSKLKKDYNSNPNSLMFYTLIVYSFNNQIRYNSKKEYNQAVGKRDFNKSMKNKLIEFVNVLHKKDISFSNLDYNEINPKNMDIKENDFVYIDPPYLISEISYNNIWGIEEEKNLLNYLDLLNENKIRFALSNVLEHKGKENEILKIWSKNYHVYELNKNYDNCVYNNQTKGFKTNEVLITNY